MKKNYRRKKEKNYFYRFTMLFMCCLLAGLLYMINVKEPFISMATIKHFQLRDITKFMFWENLFVQEKPVSASANYQLLKDHYYTNGSNQVTSLMDGVVLKVAKNEIQMLSDSGLNIVFKKMKKVDVKQDERVLKDAVLGTMEESVELHFYLNDQEITLAEALDVK